MAIALGLTEYEFLLYKAYFPMATIATLFARHEAKARIQQHDKLKLASENIRREHKSIGTVLTFFLFVQTNAPSEK